MQSVYNVQPEQTANTRLKSVAFTAIMHRSPVSPDATTTPCCGNLPFLHLSSPVLLVLESCPVLLHRRLIRPQLTNQAVFVAVAAMDSLWCLYPQTLHIGMADSWCRPPGSGPSSWLHDGGPVGCPRSMNPRLLVGHHGRVISRIKAIVSHKALQETTTVACAQVSQHIAL